MLRQAIASLRLFLSLFQEIPPLPRHVLMPGVSLLLSYPLLSVLFGPGEAGQAFVTAFLLALALRTGLRFEGMVRQLVASFSRRETALLALVAGLAPIAVLAGMDDPLWCQRSMSAYFILMGALYASDMLADRPDMAARFWPWPQMRPHLPTMTRAMVLYNLAFLLLNETMIRVLDPSYWLVFWAMLPVIAHVVLSALIVTVISFDDDRDARA